MSLEYEARAVGIADSPDGKKVLVFRTVCGRIVKITVHHNMADFAIRDLTPVEAPCA